MKAGLLASAVVLAQLAVAQPHGHRHLHKKEVVVQTVYLPEVIVYVDEAGNTVGLETKSLDPTPTPSSSESSSTPPPETPTVAPAQFAASSSAPPPPPPEPTTESPAPAAATSQAAAAPAPQSNGGGSSSKYSGSLGDANGATYSPYNDDGTCKDAGSVSSDIATLAGQGFNAIRIYGVDCNQVANVVPACRQHNLGVIAGLFNIGSVSSDLGSMKSQLQGDFGGISAITVYNEALNNGQANAATIASAIGEAKGFLSSTNFKGGVASVDTFNQLLNPANSAVIQASDFIAANCHAWFDTDTAPSGAGNFVQSRCIGPLKEIAGGKDVVITESGWPRGSPSGILGKNLASLDGQSTAIGQLRNIKGLFAFSYFSTKWHKSNTVEDFWGWAT